MKLIARCFKASIVCMLVVLFARTEDRAADLDPYAQPSKAAQPSNATTPCAASENHQFDFWVGDWDAFDFDNPMTKVARTRVDRILNGCVLREDYEGADGHEGQSFSIYDQSRKVWHQSWVTNRGELLIIEGKFQENAMVLTGVDHAKGGRLVRGTWKPENGGVRETAVTSTDGGRTWKPWFDLVFRRTAIGVNNADASAADDRKIVAALDTQYQAAVKENDTATMGRILPDDFALVTGSGKIYSKGRLARGGPQRPRALRTSGRYRSERARLG